MPQCVSCTKIRNRSPPELVCGLHGMVNLHVYACYTAVYPYVRPIAAYIQADSKVKFAAWPTSWRPPGADRLWPRGTTVNSRIWLAP